MNEQAEFISDMLSNLHNSAYLNGWGSALPPPPPPPPLPQTHTHPRNLLESPSSRSRELDKANR